MPFFFKQWGEGQELSITENTDLIDIRKAILVKSYSHNHDCFKSEDVLMRKVGKHRSGRLLDAQTYDETPR